MATIIIDLDDTIYNTKKFKEDIQNVLFAHGASVEDIWSSYKIVRATLNYTFEKHLVELAKKYPNIDTAKALPELLALLERPYILPHTKATLENFKKEKHTILLLTNGAERPQLRKIKNAGIEGYFESIHIINEEKVKFLQDLNPQGVVYFVNDKPDENELIRQAFPHFIVVEIKNGEPIVLPDSPLK